MKLRKRGSTGLLARSRSVSLTWKNCAANSGERIMKLGSDFQELLKLLKESGVKYVVVGAYALAAHGFPRNTKDLDIFYEASPDNAFRSCSFHSYESLTPPIND
jgi:hypothetical protein